MAKPYSIEIVADTAKAVKGAGDLEDAVSDLADSLDQIEDATKDAATGSERNLDKIGDSLDDIEKSAKDAATGSERQLDKIGDSLDDVGDDAKKAGQKLEDEITDGAKDAVKSADKMESSFSEAFDSRDWGKGMARYTALRLALTEGRQSYRCLDAVQLVKHAYALRTQGVKRGLGAVLVYLHAAPAIWASGKPVSAARRLATPSIRKTSFSIS